MKVKGLVLVFQLKKIKILVLKTEKQLKHRGLKEKDKMDDK